uniref:Ribosomal protein S3 n=1 Tax=Gracilariophila oryzoides TaxID=42480 RepID=E5Q3B7_9FLOR|nr:ribosomal protein S3 [Gracilariophila oryzoides]ADR03200.1 ribosomal protein S3 [Gracilariophila oryzoides]
MAKKINPISLRLGLTQVWDFTLQSYGKLISWHILLLLKQLQLKKVVAQIFNLNKFLVGEQEFWYYHNKLFLNIYFTDHIVKNQKKYSFIFKKIALLIFEWFSLKVQLRIFRKTNWITTPNLLINYATYLLKQHKNPNKVLWQLCQFLEKNLNYTKIVHSSCGIHLVNLKGFKIRLVGRSDNTKTQMSKSIQQGFGSLSLMSLKSRVEFANTELYTKLGSCGLQIWLFYEMN